MGPKGHVISRFSLSSQPLHSKNSTSVVENITRVCVCHAYLYVVCVFVCYACVLMCMCVYVCVMHVCLYVCCVCACYACVLRVHVLAWMHMEASS